MNRIIIILYILLLNFNSNAQNKSGYNMLFGDIGLYANFNNTPNSPMVFQNMININRFHAGSSCISDSANGKICF